MLDVVDTRAPRLERLERRVTLRDATRMPVAVVAGDQSPFSAGQYGADRFYATLVDGGPRAQDQTAATVVGYDTATWREIARRALDVPSALLGLSLPW